MDRKTIKFNHNPFCRVSAFKFCKKCKFCKDCYNNTEKHKIIRVTHHLSKDKLYSRIRYAQKYKKPIRLIINKPIDHEVIWDISYSPFSVIQINIRMLTDNADWVPEVVHLAERCGIMVILVLHTIVPEVVTVYDVLKILDAIKGCSNFRVILSFPIFFIHGHFKQVPYIKVHHRKILVDRLQFIWGKTWRCSDKFIADFQKLVEFYTTTNGIRLRVCKGAVLNATNPDSGFYQPSRADVNRT